MCVLVNNIDDKVLTYYKRTAAGLYKICDLHIPDSATFAESSSYSFSEKDSLLDSSVTSSTDGLPDNTVSDLDWTQEYGDTNWTEEVVDADEVEIPAWARIEGLDFNIKKEDSKEQEIDGIGSNVNQNNLVTVLADEESCQKPASFPIRAVIPNFSSGNKESIADLTDENQGGYMVADWAAKEIRDEEVDVPEWAKVPDFNFIIKTTNQMKFEPALPVTLLEESHQFVENWALEAWTETPTDIPEWTYIPNFSFIAYEKTSPRCEKFECVDLFCNSCSDDVTYMSDWAKQAFDDTDPEVPIWAKIDFDMNSVYTNRNRINKNTYFVENVFGLATVWE